MTVRSNGHQIRFGFLHWPARYENFAVIVYSVERVIGRTLDLNERLSIQTLLGAFWPAKTLHFT